MITFIHPGLALASAGPLAQNAWWAYLLWIPTAAVLGLAIAAIFAGRFRLSRSIYLVPYIVLVGLFLYAFTSWSGLSLTELFANN